MSKSPTKSTRRTKKVTSDTLSTKARQWESVRRELEAKVISLQDELSGMRKWCLAALGEAEKRTGELRSQNAAVQRQLVEETQRKVEALQSAEDNMRKLQEEKKLKLMVYGQTLTKHKEMAEESEEVQQQLEDEIVAREDAERRLTDAEAETEHLQSQLAHLEREFQLQLTQHHETTAANTEEYEAQIQKLKEQLSTAEATQVKLEQDAQAADASRRSMETRIADMEGASNIKDHQLTDLRATVERLSAQVDDKAESLRKLETEKHDMSLALSRETEAQRYLKERVDELTRDTQAHAARTKEFGDKHEDVHSQLTAATAALRDEQAKREKAEAELIRLSAHSDLPAKVLSIEKAMNELQIKLGATEAALEIANVNVATWKGDHARLKEDSRKVQEDLETQLEGMTKKNETKIAELTEALDAEQTKSIRLESETSRLNEESTRLLETKEKQAGQIETLTIQVQDLRRVSVDKETQITKFNETAQKLSEHIAELETDKTKSGHLIETTAAEKLRLSEELKVATQQLDMMREVTRQLYAKITEQTEGFSRLAEGKSTAEMARHQAQQQLSDTRHKLKLATAAQAEAETKLASRTSDLTQMAAQHDAVAHQLEAMSSRLDHEVSSRETVEQRYRRLHQKFTALSTETSGLLSDLDDERPAHRSKKPAGTRGSFGAVRFAEDSD